MTLSYSMRLLCVLTVVAGLTLAASQTILSLAARWLLRCLDRTTARWRERIVYLIQIGPAVLAMFVTVAVSLPAYLHGETNLASENVSLLCPFAAGVVFLWFGFAVSRGLWITAQTVRYARDCRRVGRILPCASEIPVLLLPDPGPPLRLIGFFRPVILISSKFTSAMQGALDLALAHERSHANQLDNWKLLTLSFLPRIQQLLPGGDPWMQPWRTAADWAADDDAVQGDGHRSLHLAQALVIAARTTDPASRAHANCVCTALTVADVGLAARVDRLLHPRQSRPFANSHLLFSIAAIAVFAALAICTLSPWIYTVSECLLHLGTT
ncbi:MAG: hypothetical protein ACLGXA_00870 [Acidobacteriota bacterium]